MNAAPLDDDTLVLQAQRGDSTAAGELFSRYWLRVWRAAYAVLGNRPQADDAAQSAMERAFRGIGSFETGRPFGPWISRIAVNQALNLVRGDRRELTLDESLPDERPTAFAEVADRAAPFQALASIHEDRRIVVLPRS